MARTPEARTAAAAEPAATADFGRRCTAYRSPGRRVIGRAWRGLVMPPPLIGWASPLDSSVAIIVTKASAKAGLLAIADVGSDFWTKASAAARTSSTGVTSNAMAGGDLEGDGCLRDGDALLRGGSPGITAPGSSCCRCSLVSPTLLGVEYVAGGGERQERG